MAKMLLILVQSSGVRIPVGLQIALLIGRFFCFTPTFTPENIITIYF